MQISEWLQTVSLIAVAVTLIITAVQSRQVIKQTQHLARQTEYVQKTIEQGSYRGINLTQDTFRSAFFKNDSSLLKWYLSERGYPVSSHRNNKRTLYLQIKLDNHETNYLNHQVGLLSDAVWQACCEVLKADAGMPEFRMVWRAAKRFYEKSFVRFVDSIL